jgi:Ankyrin repeats (3 copies)
MAIDHLKQIPLHNACTHGNDLIVKNLLLHQPERYKIAQLNALDHIRQTPLHLACKYNSPDQLIRELLDHKSDIYLNATNHIGDTPLHVIFSCIVDNFNIHHLYQRYQRSLSIFRLLITLSSTVSPSAMIPFHQKKTNYWGDTPSDILREKMNRLRAWHTRESFGEVISLLDDAILQQRWNLFHSFRHATWKDDLNEREKNVPSMEKKTYFYDHSVSSS